MTREIPGKTNPIKKIAQHIRAVVRVIPTGIGDKIKKLFL